MQKNLNKLLDIYGPPDALIDHWDKDYMGYAIWGFEDYIIWDSTGKLYLNHKKLKPSLNTVQSIINKWKKGSNDLSVIGFLSYDFKNILYPHLKFKKNKTKFPYLFFAKPKKIIKYKINKESINYKKFLQVNKDIIPPNKYQKTINLIKDELENGNTYQINFTMPKKYKIKKDPLTIYLQLRNIAQPKVGFYIKACGYHILSLSPERFFEKKNNILYSYPMKGTRKRSNNRIIDNQLKRDLKKSKKDQAEHLMIVDLIRNDIGKIATIGSISVEKIFNVESYETVHQMITCIKGKLKEKIKECDVIAALFPGGSVTGAPKESAMKIIDTLETYNRGIYTGSIGYIKKNGDMDFNIPIRTLTIKNKNATYPVGGGIVWDSKSMDEWEEAQTKSDILSKVII